MSTLLARTSVAAAAACVALTAFVAAAEEPSVRKNLDALSRRQILFGHQSVGQNLLDGLRDLAAAEGVTLRIRDVSAAPEAPPATLAHLFVATNGDPAAKIERFAQAVAALPAPGAQIALLKLCYADFSPATDVSALFARYQETLAALRAKHPATAFVHVTVPLTRVQGGPKALVKKLLGRPPGGLAENARREEFNALVRATYAGREPLVDLAALESTGADGARRTVDWNGKPVPELAAEYTDDGGHLNPVGRLRAARALLEVLAQVPLPPATAERGSR